MNAQNNSAELEERLAGIWSESLQIERIGRDDNFFELGGDSARAMVLLEKVAECLSVRLPFISILRHPTVHEMADLVARRMLVADDPAKSDNMEPEDGTF
jgi:aryl carrier-like protein